jgi:WD40 repeat protein
MAPISPVMNVTSRLLQFLLLLAPTLFGCNDLLLPPQTTVVQAPHYRIYYSQQNPAGTDDAIFRIDADSLGHPAEYVTGGTLGSGPQQGAIAYYFADPLEPGVYRRPLTLPDTIPVLVGIDDPSIPLINTSAVLSPDGQNIAYVAVDNKNYSFVIHITGSGREIPVFDPLGTLGLQTTPSPKFSPDGRYLAFYGALDQTVGYTMNVLDLQGGDPVPYQLNSDLQQLTDFDWSPTGDSIAFGGVYYYAGGPSAFTSISILNLRDSLVSPLVTSDTMSLDTQPAWSPDGKKIAFVRVDDQTSRGDLYIVKLDGTVRRLTESAGIKLFPNWSPDGSKILFSLPDSASADIRGGLSLVDVATGNEQVVVESGAYRGFWETVERTPR